MDGKSENFKIRTVHNEFIARRRGSRFELHGRDGALHSVVDLEDPGQLQLENLVLMMTALLFIPRPQSILVLGTAAGSLLHYLRRRLPRAELTSVDIDAAMVERLLQAGLLPEPGEKLEYVHADAAAWVPACERRFDLILVDIFNGARSPGWLLDETFIAALRASLSEHGAAAYNLLIPSNHDFERFYRRLRRSYADLTLQIPAAELENRIVCAFRAVHRKRDLQSRLQAATALSDELGIDCLRLLNLACNSNPAGVGPL